VVASFAYFAREQLFRIATAPCGEATSPSREAKKLLHPEGRENPPVRELHASRRTKLELQRASATTRTRTHMHTRAYALAHPRAHGRTPRRHEHSLAHAHAHGVNKQNECERLDQNALTLAGRSLAALRAAYESAPPRRSVSATSSSASADEHKERFEEREIYNTYRKIVR
jgi:hypothetical protein